MTDNGKLTVTMQNTVRRWITSGHSNSKIVKLVRERYAVEITAQLVQYYRTSPKPGAKRKESR